MFKAFQLIFCIFLSSSFAGLVQEAKANYCFENTNKNGILATNICFKEIKILKPGSLDAKVYLKGNDVDDIYPVKKWTRTPAGFALEIQGDYVNYSSNCGVTILSQMVFQMNTDSNYQYSHVAGNELHIKYRYTPNNCQAKAVHGTETFTPVR